MLERMTVQLSRAERMALQRAAEDDLRDFRSEARLFICKELERRGLLSIQKMDQVELQPSQPQEFSK